MTLVAPLKQPRHHRKVSGQHHRRSKTYHKPYWPYIPIIAVISLGIWLNAAVPAHRGVLAYATDMSIQGLLDGTNAQRTANNLGNLSLNAQLDQAAQNKANDMVSRDYWAHNTPDGQTPWTFYAAVGYNFQTAGENLAYGFDNAANTITGWMNSPGHRANILNTTYQEVGFGVANSSNFVGTGPETIVVAEYAEPVGAVTPVASTPAASKPAPAATSSAPSNQAAPASQPSQTAPAETPAPAADPQTPPNTDQQVVVSPSTNLKPVAESAPVKISRIQALTAGEAPWSLTALTIIIAVGMFLFFVRHSIAWHRVIRKGERFVIKHPALDIAAAVIIVAAILLTRTTGIIR